MRRPALCGDSPKWRPQQEGANPSWQSERVSKNDPSLGKVNAFTIFSHPIEGIVSDYYYIQRAEWEKDTTQILPA